MTRTWASFLNFTLDEGPDIPTWYDNRRKTSPYEYDHTSDPLLSFSRSDRGESCIVERSLSALRTYLEEEHILHQPIPEKVNFALKRLEHSIVCSQIAYEMNISQLLTSMIDAADCIASTIGGYRLQKMYLERRYSHKSDCNVHTTANAQYRHPLRTISVQNKLWSVLDEHIDEMHEDINFEKKTQRHGRAVLTKV
jgi:hypothetical protein